MSEQDIVVPDQAHEVLPPEVNQNDVKNRIDDLIKRDGPEKAKIDDEVEDVTTTVVEPGAESSESLEDSSVDDEIAGLDADDKAPETDADEVEQPEVVETLDAKSLAEKLGVSVEEIYGMKFPYGEDGDAITLGELKDAGIRARTIDQEAETLSDERNSFINEQMKSRSELQNIVSMLPDGIPPELIQAANYQHQQAVQRERISLLEAIPDWQDIAIETTAREAIAANLKQYGFQDIEISNMLDHRLVKLIHDFTRMRQKIVEPKAEIQRIKKLGKRPRSGSRRTRGEKQVAEANQIGRTDTRGAINKLLPRD